MMSSLYWGKIFGVAVVPPVNEISIICSPPEIFVRVMVS